MRFHNIKTLEKFIAKIKLDKKIIKLMQLINNVNNYIF